MSTAEERAPAPPAAPLQHGQLETILESAPAPQTPAPPAQLGKLSFGGAVEEEAGEEETSWRDSTLEPGPYGQSLAQAVAQEAGAAEAAPAAGKGAEGGDAAEAADARHTPGGAGKRTPDSAAKDTQDSAESAPVAANGDGEGEGKAKRPQSTPWKKLRAFHRVVRQFGEVTKGIMGAEYDDLSGVSTDSGGGESSDARLHTYPHAGRVFCVGFVPDGETLVVGGGGNEIKLHDVREMSRRKGARGSAAITMQKAPRPPRAEGRREARHEGRRHIQHGTRVRALAVAPDGKSLVVADGKKVVHYDLETHEVLHKLNCDDNRVRSVAFSHSGKFLLCGGDGNACDVRDAHTFEKLRSYAQPGHVACVCYSPDDSHIALCGAVDISSRGHVTILRDDAGNTRPQPRDGASRKEQAQGEDQSDAAAARVAAMKSCRSAAQVRAWDSDEDDANAAATHTFDHPKRVRTVIFSPQGSLVAAGGDEGKICVYNSNSGETLHRHDNGGFVWGMAFSPSGSKLATGGGDHRVTVYDVYSWIVLHRFPHEGFVASLAYSPAGDRLAAADSANKCVMYNMRTPAEGYSSHEVGWVSNVHAAEYSRDGKILVVGSNSETVTLLRARTFRPFRSFSHMGPVRAVSLSPDSTLVASGSDDCYCLVHAVSSESDDAPPVHRLKHDGKVLAVAFAPDGLKLAAGGEDNHLTVYSVGDGAVLQRLKLEGRLRSVAFARDSTLCAAGGNDERVTIVSVRDGSVVHTFSQKHTIRAIAFAPNGVDVAYGGDDCTVTVRDIKTGDVTRQIAHHAEGFVSAIEYSANGRMLAAAQGHDAAVYDVSGEDEVALPVSRAMPSTVTTLAFAPSSNTLAIVAGQNIRICDAHHGTGAMSPFPCSMLYLAQHHPESATAMLRHNPFAVNVGDAHGNTPLHLAVMRNAADAVKLLVCQSPDHAAMLPNAEGNTPLTIAIEQYQSQCVQALLSAIQHTDHPMCRNYVVDSDLVPLIQHYPALATQLFNNIGLEPAGAKIVVRSEGENEDADVTGTEGSGPPRAKMLTSAPHSFAGNIVAGSVSQQPAQHQWELTGRKANRRARDPNAFWHTWSMLTGVVDERNPVVEVEAVVCGFRGITNNRALIEALRRTKHKPLLETEIVRVVLEHHWRSRHFKTSLVQMLLYMVLLGCYHTWLNEVASGAIEGGVANSGRVFIYAVVVTILCSGFIGLEYAQYNAGALNLNAAKSKAIEKRKMRRSSHAAGSPISMSSLRHLSQTNSRRLSVSMFSTGAHVLRSAGGARKRHSISRTANAIDRIRKAGRYNKAARYLSDGWNTLDLLSLGFMMYSIVSWWVTDGVPPDRNVMALAALLSSYKMLGLLRTFRAFASLVAVLNETVKDTMPFLILFATVLLGFGSAFRSFGEFEGGMSEAVYITFMRLIGGAAPLEMDGGILRKLLMVACFLFVFVMMTNLLIAIISDTFDRVQEEQNAQYQKERVCLIMENNAVLDLWSSTTEPPAVWLHVLRPRERATSHSRSDWVGRMRDLKTHGDRVQRGLASRMQAANDRFEERLNNIAASTKRHFTTSEERHAALEAKVDTLLELLKKTQ